MSNGFTKCYSGKTSFTHHFKGSFAQANCSHAVMNSSWPQSSLRYLKASALPKEHVTFGNSNIIKLIVSMAMRSIIITKDMHHFSCLNSRSIGRYQYHRMALMPWSVRILIRNAHENNNFAPWISCSRSPPLLSINDILIAI